METPIHRCSVERQKAVAERLGIILGPDITLSPVDTFPDPLTDEQVAGCLRYLAAIPPDSGNPA
jgi:hypothetical protein